MAENKATSIAKFNDSVAQFYKQPVAKISIELFLSFGLVLFLVIVAIQPTLTTIAKLNKEVQEKKELTSKLSSKIAALTTAINIYNQYQDKIPLLNDSLPPTARLIPTLKIVEKIAGESNVVITAMSAQKVPDETDDALTSATATLQSLPISVTVMGQYQDMRQFVEALHGSRRTIQVLSANFSLEETRGQRALSANFILDAPYYGVAQ